MAKEASLLVGSARIWLGAGVVAALLGFALWRYATTPQVESVGREAGKGYVHVPTAPPGAARSEVSDAHSAQAVSIKAFEDLKQRAQLGDAVAQRKLADAYDTCLQVNLNREEFIRGVELNKRLLKDAAERDALERALLDAM